MPGGRSSRARGPVLAACGLHALLALFALQANAPAAIHASGAQATAGPSATATRVPTPTPIVVNGRVRAWQAADGCQGDAVLVDCLSPTVAYILRAPAGIDFARYMGQQAQIEGLVRDCGAGGTYVAVSKVTPLDRCENPLPSAPLNLALHAPAFQDDRQQSPIPGFDPGHVTDGDAQSYWFYPTSGPSVPTWLRLDLGAEMSFNVMRLKWGDRFADHFALYVWNPRFGNSGKWVPVHQQLAGKGGDESITLARVTGRFVLIYLTHGGDPNGGYQLREWEIYNKSSPNLVLGQSKNVRVSSAQGGYGGQLAVDGSLQFGWASAGGDPAPYIVARLPATHAVTDYRLVWRWPAIPANYRVVFYRGSEPYAQTSPQISTEPIHTLSWRNPFDIDAFGVFAESVGNEAGYIELLEMELYGPDDSGSIRPVLSLPGGPDLGSTVFQGGRDETVQPAGAVPRLEGPLDQDGPARSLEPVPPGAFPRLGE